MSIHNGMILVTPSSVDHTGTSTTINASGSVAFTACSVLSLNGVFSEVFDNYIIDIRSVLNSGDSTIDARLRSSGSDATTNYTYQYVIASSTSVTGARSTTYGYAVVGNTSATQRSGDISFVYGPALVQPTAFRNVSARGSSSATIADWACTHSTSASYDGITLFVGGGTNFSGLVKVYGLRQ